MLGAHHFQELHHCPETAPEAAGVTREAVHSAVGASAHERVALVTSCGRLAGYQARNATPRTVSVLMSEAGYSTLLMRTKNVALGYSYVEHRSSFQLGLWSWPLRCRFGRPPQGLISFLPPSLYAVYMKFISIYYVII